MTPVFQTTSTNCLRACIASLLDIGIDEVTIACDGAPDHWNWAKFQNWLAKRFQLQAIEVVLSGKPVFAAPTTPVLCVLTFEAPQEPVTGKHAVVGEFIGTEGFRLLHDPHRSGDGPTGELYAVMFLTSINPTPPLHKEHLMSPAEQLAATKAASKPDAIKKANCTREFPWQPRLKELRGTLRLSLDEVAEAAQLSKSALWELEQGGDPMLSTAARLAELFGKSIEEIWPKQKDLKTALQKGR